MTLSPKIKKLLKIAGISVALVAAGFIGGRYFVPPEIRTETKIVEKIVVQERTFLAVKTRVKNNVKTVVERVSMPDGTIVEKSTEIDKSTTDTNTVIKDETMLVKSNLEQSSTIIAAPKSNVSVLLGTNLQLDPIVGVAAATPAGPVLIGGFVTVPINKPADVAAGVSVGISF